MAVAGKRELVLGMLFEALGIWEPVLGRWAQVVGMLNQDVEALVVENNFGEASPRFATAAGSSCR